MMDPTQQAAMQSAGAPGAAAAGAVVCIASQPDGSFMVYSQDQDPSQGQPAQDVNAALQAAAQLLTGQASDNDNDNDADNAGAGAPGGSSSADDDADALFQSGFNGARGTPLGK